MAKRQPQVGDEAWEVEWVYELAFYDDDPNGDVDRDNCKERSRLFATREAALAFAVKTWPSTVDKFGIVSITPIRFVAFDDDEAVRYPHAGYWDSIGDTETLSDDSGVPE